MSSSRPLSTTLKILEILEQGFEIRVWEDTLNDLFTPSIAIDISDMNTRPINHHRQVVFMSDLIDSDDPDNFLVNILQQMTITLKRMRK